MKTRFKTLKDDKVIKNNDLFNPQFGVEKIYFPLFLNSNLRNSQNYVLGNNDKKLVNLYTYFTFLWGSVVRMKTKNFLILFRKKKFDEVLILFFLFLITFFLSFMNIFQTYFFPIFFAVLLFIFQFFYFKKYNLKTNKKIIILKNKNKFIILNKGKLDSRH